MDESKRALNAPFDTPPVRKGIGNAAHMGAFRSSIDSFLHADDFLFGDKMLQNASKIFFSYFYLARISKNYIFAFVFKRILVGAHARINPTTKRLI